MGKMTNGFDLNQFTPFINSSIDYVQNSLIPALFVGDPMAIAIVGIISIILLVVVFKVSGIVYALLKRIFLFLIVGFSLYFFLLNYADKLMQEGLTGQLIVFGVIGIALGLIALLFALTSVGKHAKEVRKRKAVQIEEEVEEEIEKAVEPGAPAVRPTQITQPEMLTEQALRTPGRIVSSLKNDRSLLAVLSYVIIAQFGVFSGVTLSAPNVSVGIALFIAFFIGAFVFIKTTYHKYKTGIKHLITASVFGVALSILLGHYWALIPLEQLLSLNYFQSTSLVAFVTGIAVSLLMGSKD